MAEKNNKENMNEEGTELLQAKLAKESSAALFEFIKKHQASGKKLPSTASDLIAAFLDYIEETKGADISRAYKQYFVQLAGGTPFSSITFEDLGHMRLDDNGKINSIIAKWQTDTLEVDKQQTVFDIREQHFQDALGKVGKKDQRKELVNGKFGEKKKNVPTMIQKGENIFDHLQALFDQLLKECTDDEKNKIQKHFDENPITLSAYINAFSKIYTNRSKAKIESMLGTKKEGTKKIRGVTLLHKQMWDLVQISLFRQGLQLQEDGVQEIKNFSNTLGHTGISTSMFHQYPYAEFLKSEKATNINTLYFKKEEEERNVIKHRQELYHAYLDRIKAKIAKDVQREKHNVHGLLELLRQLNTTPGNEVGLTALKQQIISYLQEEYIEHQIDTTMAKNRFKALGIKIDTNQYKTFRKTLYDPNDLTSSFQCLDNNNHPKHVTLVFTEKKLLINNDALQDATRLEELFHFEFTLDLDKSHPPEIGYLFGDISPLAMTDNHGETVPLMDYRHDLALYTRDKGKVNRLLIDKNQPLTLTEQRSDGTTQTHTGYPELSCIDDEMDDHDYHGEIAEKKEILCKKEKKWTKLGEKDKKKTTLLEEITTLRKEIQELEEKIKQQDKKNAVQSQLLLKNEYGKIIHAINLDSSGKPNAYPMLPDTCTITDRKRTRTFSINPPADSGSRDPFGGTDQDVIKLPALLHSAIAFSASGELATETTGGKKLVIPNKQGNIFKEITTMRFGGYVFSSDTDIPPALTAGGKDPSTIRAWLHQGKMHLNRDYFKTIFAEYITDIYQEEVNGEAVIYVKLNTTTYPETENKAYTMLELSRLKSADGQRLMGKKPGSSVEEPLSSLLIASIQSAYRHEVTHRILTVKDIHEISVKSTDGMDVIVDQETLCEISDGQTIEWQYDANDEKHEKPYVLIGPHKVFIASIEQEIQKTIPGFTFADVKRIDHKALGARESDSQTFGRTSNIGLYTSQTSKLQSLTVTNVGPNSTLEEIGMFYLGQSGRSREELVNAQPEAGRYASILQQYIQQGLKGTLDRKLQRMRNRMQSYLTQLGITNPSEQLRSGNWAAWDLARLKDVSDNRITYQNNTDYAIYEPYIGDPLSNNSDATENFLIDEMLGYEVGRLQAGVQIPDNKRQQIENIITPNTSGPVYSNQLINAGRVLREGLYFQDQEITNNNTPPIIENIDPNVPPYIEIGGRRMPRLGFGTYSLSNAEQVIQDAINNGYTHIDTASGYIDPNAGGTTNMEDILQTVIANNNRENLYITSKLSPTQGNNSLTHPLNKEEVKRFVQEHIQKFGGRIETLLMHRRPVDYTERDMDIVFECMTEEQQAGTIGSIGASNFSLQQVQWAINKGYPLQVIQTECHPYYMDVPLINYCKANNIIVQAYAPFGSDRSSSSKLMDENKPKPIDDPVIQGIASEINRSPQQVILRYLLQKGVVPLAQSSDPNHQRENAEIFNRSLTDNQISQIDQLNKGLAGSIFTERYLRDGIFTHNRPITITEDGGNEGGGNEGGGNEGGGNEGETGESDNQVSNNDVQQTSTFDQLFMSNITKGDKDAQPVPGTIVFFKEESSALPGGGNNWVKLQIIEPTNTTEISFELVGASEKVVTETQKATKPKNNETRQRLRNLGGSEMYKFNGSTQFNQTRFLEHMQAQSSWEDTATLQKKFFENNQEKRGKITHVGKIIQQISSETAKSDIYKITRGSDKVTVRTDLNDEEYWEHTMDYDTFYLFCLSKNLDPLTDEEVARADTDRQNKGENSEGRPFSRRDKLTSRKSISRMFKNIKESFEHKWEQDQKMQGAELMARVANVIPRGVDGGLLYRDDIKSDAIEEVDATVWQVVQEYKNKLARGNDSGSDVHGAKTSTIIKEEIFDVPIKSGKRWRLKAAGYLLHALEGGGPYFRKLAPYANRDGGGYWIRVLLGDIHHKKFLNQKKKLVDEYKSTNASNDDLQDEIAKLELHYLQAGMTDHPFWGSKVGREIEGFRDDLRSSSKIESIKTGMASKGNIYDIEEATRFAGEFQQMPRAYFGGLEAMEGFVEEQKHYSEFYKTILMPLVTGYTTIFSKSLNDRFKGICRRRGIPIGLSVGHSQQTNKVVSILDYIGKKGPNQDSLLKKIKDQIPDFDPKSIYDGNYARMVTPKSGGPAVPQVRIISDIFGSWWAKNGVFVMDAFNFENNYLTSFADDETIKDTETEKIIEAYYGSDGMFGGYKAYQNDVTTSLGDGQSPFYTNGIINLAEGPFKSYMMSFDVGGNITQQHAVTMRENFGETIRNLDRNMASSKANRVVTEVLYKKFTSFFSRSLYGDAKNDFNNALRSGDEKRVREAIEDYVLGYKRKTDNQGRPIRKGIPISASIAENVAQQPILQFGDLLRRMLNNLGSGKNDIIQDDDKGRKIVQMYPETQSEEGARVVEMGPQRSAKVA